MNKQSKFIKKMALIAILSAVSFGLYYINFPIPFLFPGFLKVNFSNLPILIGGFTLGPVAGTAIVIIRFLIKLPLTDTVFVGEIADLIIGFASVIPAAIIYRHNKSKKGAAMALVISTLFWIASGMLANMFVLVPAYIKIYFNGNINSFVNTLKIIPGVTEHNYMSKYILWAVIPFNTLISVVVNIITYIVYKRISFLVHSFTGDELKLSKRQKEKIDKNKSIIFRQDWKEYFKKYFIIGISIMLLLLIASFVMVLISINAINLTIIYLILKIILISIETIGVFLIGTYLFFRFKSYKTYDIKDEENEKID
ncbi:MAG: ECF transporter S component [Bacilli bacterium]|nr:ECF transporter S component [Bacilli bacterium]MDY0363164.1 ECF transporter S component [Bacilli bacterium]